MNSDFAKTEGRSKKLSVFVFSGRQDGTFNDGSVFLTNTTGFIDKSMLLIYNRGKFVISKILRYSTISLWRAAALGIISGDGRSLPEKERKANVG